MSEQDSQSNVSRETTRFSQPLLSLWRGLSPLYDFWFLAAWAVFCSLLVLFSVDLGRGNWSVIGAMVVGATTYLFLQQKDLKEIFFYAHVRKKSWLQIFRFRQIGLLLITLILGAILILSLLVFLLTSHWSVLVAVCLVMLLFPPLRKFYWRNLAPQFKQLSGVFLTNLFTSLTLGTLLMLGMIGAKWLQLTYFVTEFTLRSSDHMADHVINRVEYSILWLQHLGRTLAMFELQILRAHEYAEGWLGHALLIYFLFPSTLAAFSLPVLFAGLFFFFKGNNAPGPNHIN